MLTLPGDNDTWSVTVFGLSGDAALKSLRDPDCFTRVVAACPGQVHWLDGRPTTGVLPMAGVLDRHRRFVVEGRPVVTGFAAVGDAWASTNPSVGRGLSVGLLHAQQLRDVARTHLDDPAGFASAWDERTERVVAPYFWDQVGADRARVSEMTASRDGGERPAPDPTTGRFLAAARHDPVVFRGLLETVLCLALPGDVLARPEIRTVVEREPLTAPGPPPGPDRSRLLALLAG